MLTHFKIKNFKAFAKEQEIKIAPITLIFGPNSGGKSSILQSLLLFKQSIDSNINSGLSERHLLTKGKYVDLGTSKSIHHRHSITNPLEFEFGFTPDLRNRYLNKVDLLSLRVQFSDLSATRKLKLPVLTSATYQASSTKIHSEFAFTIERKERNVSKTSGKDLIDECEETQERDNFFTIPSNKEHQNYLRFVSKLPIVRAQEFTNIPTIDVLQAKRFQVGYRPFPMLKIPFIPYLVRDLEEKTFGNFESYRLLQQIETTFRRLISSISYLGPLRSKPRRIYDLSQEFEGSVGVSGEDAIEALAFSPEVDDEDPANEKSEDTVDFVNRWLENFEIPYKISINSMGDELTGDFASLKLLDKRTNITVAPTDVGFGISQLLPIIIEGALAVKRATQRNSPIICIEQPEIHLHPRLQACIGDFLIDSCKKTKSQWIIETHSEALMLRIQKRIREGVILADDISVVYVDPISDGGSRIVNLRLDESGNFIDEWPGGFFEESFNEIFS